jgi:hypothetical protein
MSTAAPKAPPADGSRDREIVVISHSGLFYWWPVWAIGLVFALATLVDGHRLAIVPRGAHAEAKAAAAGEGDQQVEHRIRIAASKNYGVIFVVVLLLVILITNVPLRGLWSVIVLIVVILGTVILALAGVWEAILGALGSLHIYINMGGYLTISIALLAMWAIVTFFFDRQVYMIFSPGGMRVREEIGGGESTYDTTGMVVQKQRNDLFRHWILGLGSGDLIVNTAGASAHHFNLPNVLFVGYKLSQIEDLIREKQVRAQV